MLEYIKSQIRERNDAAKPVQESVEPADVPNDVIMEYAHLFQELDDALSEEGSWEGERKLGVDIPLDDDTEIESIELNLDGRVEDIPGDAEAPSVTEEYATMKTYDKFFAEAAQQVARLPRESDDAYCKRVSKLADKMYTEYCVDAEKIGAFGFRKYDITDERVPSKIKVNFGAISQGSDESYVGKVNTFFATDEDHKITKKQLDSVRLVQDGALKNIGPSLMSYMESKYDVPSGSSVWDVCTPTNIIVPKGNGDSFCVVLEYMNEITNQKEYFGWSRPVREDIDTDYEKINMESFVNETHYENKDTVIQEAAANVEVVEKPKKKFSRFFQEAIDMGTGDAGADTDNGGNAAEPPPIDGDAGSADQATDTGNADATSTDTEQSSDDASKETAAVNNVSSEIAEKVADSTQADATGDDEQITFPDETSGDTGSTDGGDSSVSFDSPDAGTGDTSMDEGESVDDQLDDLDNTNAEGDELGDEEGLEGDEGGSIENDGDIDSMSMEEIMNNASDKLKNMPLSELKEFLANGENTSADFQEAFILTKKNINKEVDVRLRKCLGILNDNKMNIDKLMKKFKLEGHSLNRVLIKASKASDVYSSDEQNDLKKLNSALGELMVALKKSNDSSYVSSVKRKIEAFTKQSKVVAAFVEDKMEKPVQESFIQEGLFLSETNVKKRLGSKIPPVHADLSEIVRAYDSGKLTKGKLMKMYKPAKTEYQRTYGGYSGNGSTTDNRYGGTIDTTTVNKSYEVDTVQMDHIHSLLKIVGKTLRKSKVQRAFTSDQLEQIDTLGEALDDFVDYLESLIIDTSDNKSLVDQVGKDAKKLLTLLAAVYNFCSGLDSVPRHRRYEDGEALGGEVPEEGAEELGGEDSLGGEEPVSEEPEVTEGSEDTSAEETEENEETEEPESEEKDDDKDEEEGEDE
jgi:hypothetical protein